MFEITTPVSDTAAKPAVSYPATENAEPIDLTEYAEVIDLDGGLDFDLDGKYTDEDHEFHSAAGQDHLTNVNVEQVAPSLIAQARDYAEQNSCTTPHLPFYNAYEGTTALRRDYPVVGRKQRAPMPRLGIDEVKAAFAAGGVLTGSLIDTPRSPARPFPNAVYAHVSVRADRPLTEEQWNTALMNNTFRGDNRLEEFVVPFWAQFRKGKSASITAVYELYQNHPKLQKDVLPEDALPISALSELEDGIADSVQSRLDPNDGGKFRVKGAKIRRTTRSGNKPFIGIIRFFMAFQNRRCQDLLTPIADSQQQRRGGGNRPVQRVRKGGLL
jgi:hypothetical protein